MYIVCYDVDYFEMGGVGYRVLKTKQEVMLLIKELCRVHKDVNWSDIDTVNAQIKIFRGEQLKITEKKVITEYGLG